MMFSSSAPLWQFLHEEWLLCAVLSFLEDGGDDIHHLWLLALDDGLTELQRRLQQHFLLSVDYARRLAMARSSWSVLCKLSPTVQYTKGQRLTEDQVDQIEEELRLLGIPPHPDRRPALLTAVGREHKTGSSRWPTCLNCRRASSHHCRANLHRCIAPGPKEEPHFCRAASPFVMYVAAREGHLESVVWLHYVVCYDQERALSAAAYKGHADVVDWLLDHPHSNITVDFRYRDDEELGVNAWRVSTFSQYYTMTKKWGVNSTLEDYIPECLAAKHGDIEGLRQIQKYELFHRGFKMSAPQWAASEGHFDVLRFLSDHGAVISKSGTLWSAVTGGHLEIVQWLVTNGYCTVNDQAIRGAIFYGHVDILEWLLNTVGDVNAFSETIQREAGNTTHIPVLEWLVQNRNLRLTIEHARFAILYKATDRAKWIINHCLARGAISNGQALLEKAIKADHVELVKWFVVELNFWSPMAFQLASVGRSVDILEFIYQQVLQRPSASFSLRPQANTVALLVPVRRNRFNVCSIDAIEWLMGHGFQSGLFTIQAMDEVLEIERSYARTKRQFGLYNFHGPTTMEHVRTLLCRIIHVEDPEFLRQILWLPSWAASHGKLDALKRLAAIGHVNMFTRRTFDRLLLQNASEMVVQWFLEQQPQLFTTIVIRWAVIHGKRGLLEWVFQLFLPTQTDTALWPKSIRTALWTAARYNHDDILRMLPQWTLTTNDPVLWRGISQRDVESSRVET